MKLSTYYWPFSKNKFLRFKIWFVQLKVKKKNTRQVFISNQRVPKRFGTPYGFRNPYMLPSTDTYSWHFNVRCMQMDSLIFHSSNYIASRQARSAKVSWNVEFLKILFPYPSAFSNKNEKRIWWQVRRRGRASREGKNVLIQFFLFLKPKPLVIADWQICAQ